MRDKSYSAHGKSMSLKDWAIHLGVQYQTLWARLNKGIDVELALVVQMKVTKRLRNPDKTITKKCDFCAKEFVIPRSRDWRENCCSSECKRLRSGARLTESIQMRTRTCKVCQATFVARNTQLEAGGGRYCSVACHFKEFGMRQLHRPEVQRLAAERSIALRKVGGIRYHKGADNHKWSGGSKASRARAVEKRRANPEKFRDDARAYRARNHEKVKEWAQRRKGRKIGRLPRFTITKLYVAQRGQCPVCKVKFGKKYHVDHIVPLARGGLHEPKNLQLLCKSCNLTKSAKDPISFMRERGFLL